MPERVCYYEILAVEMDVDQTAIKRAYRKKALKWHPDKNLDNAEEAEIRFKEIQAAFEVLSDVQQRAWYDDHRQEYLDGDDGNDEDDPFKDSGGVDLGDFVKPGMYSGFKPGKQNNFYSIYSQLFEHILGLERKGTRGDDDLLDYRLLEAEFGDETSEYADVRAFYIAWRNFHSIRTFAWKDKWDLNDAPSRRVRRLMAADNKKIRAAGKKLFQKQVLQVVAFAMGKDPRVLEAAAARKQEKLKQERERKKQEKVNEKERAKLREEFATQEQSRMEEQRQRMKQIYGHEFDTESDNEGAEVEVHVCVVCKKNFKTLAQIESHENSKKHKKALKTYIRLHGVPPARNRAQETDEIVKKQALECPSCGYVFKNKKQLKAHNNTPEHAAMVLALRDELVTEEKLAKGESILGEDAADDEEFAPLDATTTSSSKKEAKNKSTIDGGDATGGAAAILEEDGQEGKKALLSVAELEALLAGGDSDAEEVPEDVVIPEYLTEKQRRAMTKEQAKKEYEAKAVLAPVVAAQEPEVFLTKRQKKALAKEKARRAYLERQALETDSDEEAQPAVTTSDSKTATTTTTTTTTATEDEAVTGEKAKKAEKFRPAKHKNLNKKQLRRLAAKEARLALLSQKPVGQPVDAAEEARQKQAAEVHDLAARRRKLRKMEAMIKARKDQKARKGHPCSVCRQTFTSYPQLKQHLDQEGHHSKANETPGK